ncbi:hypothetical protein Syun_017039 [Stephania yunnanensis]|uniref:Uncharacterized protein n=1 Tax=Stephania yunnanensis TaxID=152371 RepID=A0AAP0P203_9MAGN
MFCYKCIVRYHSLCSYMGDDDMFSSDLSNDQLRMRLGHMSNIPCQVDEKSLAEGDVSTPKELLEGCRRWSRSYGFIFSNRSETELLYSVSDPLLIKDGSETEYNNFISDLLPIRDGLETESNNSVSDSLLIRDGSEMKFNNSVSDPLLIRDESETEYNNSVSDPLLIREGSETECNYNCTP